MTEIQIIKRKTFLKRQAVKVIRNEINDLKLRLYLTEMKSDLEARMGKDFDPVLSRKLDSVLYLLES